VGIITFPSPHISVHTLAVEESPKVQDQLASTEQVEEQPSLFEVLPSSQYPAVGFTTLPSPQISVQVLAVNIPPEVQVQSVSTEQEEDHPSLLFVFPSSQ